MWQYIVTFTFSCLFAGAADYCFRIKEKKAFVLCSFFAVFIGALLAGLRADSVGTDVLGYGNAVFERAAQLNSLLLFFQVYRDTIEPLYLLFNYLISRFTDDPHWMYFFLQFLMMSFVYAALVDLKKRTKIEIWLGLLVYYTTFYGFSLNGMRQAVAMCVVFWGMKFIYQKRLLPYIVSVAFAAGFHYTALISLPFYYIYIWFERSKEKRLMVIILAVVFVGIALGYRQILEVITLIIPKYERYLYAEGGEYSLNPIIVRLPFLLLYILCYKIYKAKNKNVDFLIVMLTGDAVFSMLRGAMAALYRCSFYFAVTKMIAYPMLCQGFNKRSRGIAKCVLIIVLFIIWYYQHVMQGNEDIYPYVSDVWKWLN